MNNPTAPSLPGTYRPRAALCARPSANRAASRTLVNVSSVAGRRVGAGGGIYQLTKHGVGTFSEALRQELTARMSARH
jgi:NADP-dependent 3-hydroxy acid dehydrogenase YdfG